jgi:hypothetical protein
MLQFPVLLAIPFLQNGFVVVDRADVPVRMVTQ